MSGLECSIPIFLGHGIEYYVTAIVRPWNRDVTHAKAEKERVKQLRVLSEFKLDKQMLLFLCDISVSL